MALLLREPEGQQPLRRAVAVATLGVLGVLFRERPLLVGIDDVQWLDPASESVLAFVARRLQHERVGVFVARRAEAVADVPLDLARAMPEGRFGRVRIEPLEPAELARCLRTLRPQTVILAPPRSDLGRVEHSGEVRLLANDLIVSPEDGLPSQREQATGFS